MIKLMNQSRGALFISLTNDPCWDVLFRRDELVETAVLKGRMKEWVLCAVLKGEMDEGVSAAVLSRQKG